MPVRAHTHTYTTDMKARNDLGGKKGSNRNRKGVREANGAKMVRIYYTHV